MNIRPYIYEGLVFTEEDFLPPRRNRFWALISDWAQRLSQRHADAQKARREREEFRRLDARQLSDIGLSEYTVIREMNS